MIKPRYILISTVCPIKGCEKRGLGWGDENNEDLEHKNYEAQLLKAHNKGEHK